MRARTLIRKHSWVDLPIDNQHDFREVYDWCKDILDNNEYMIREVPRFYNTQAKYKIVFKNSADATLFQLTWG